MTSRGRVALVPLLLWLATACAGPGPDAEPIAEASLAVNVCDETVPSDRLVDGFPAYAQCSAVENGNIWSNNGIDTSATSLGDDWIQTQRGGGYQCTEWAYRYMHFRWGVDYRHGNAEEWCDGELPSTLVKATTPVHGDLIVFAGGVCGASESTGHIAVIDVVDTAAAKVTIVEENRAGRRTANQSCGSCFLHAVANDGSAGAGGNGNSGGAGAGGVGGKASGQGGLSALGGSPGLGGRATIGGTAGTSEGGGTGGALNGRGGAPVADAGDGGTASGGRAPGGQAGTSAAPASAGAGGSTAGGSGGRAAAGGASSGVAGGAATEEPPFVLEERGVDSGGGCAVTPKRGAGAGWALPLALLLGAALRRRRSTP